jgi:membrane fusion protein (multidrug efflux system)
MTKRFATVLWLAMGVLGVCCARGARDETETLRSVVINTPEIRVMGLSLLLLGEVEAYRKAALSFPISGIIAEMNAEIGDTAREGQVLARLRQEEFLAGLEQASAAHEKAKKDLAKVERLYAEELTSEDRLEGARLAVKQAHAAYVMASEAFRNSTIRAPFHGVISYKSGEPSEMYSAMVGPAAVYKVVDVSSVKVTLGIPGDELGKVAVGQEGLLTVSAYPSQEFWGRLTLVGVEVDNRSRTATAQLLVPNDEGLLKPGMVGDVTLLVGEPREVLTLPEGVLLDDMGLSYVYLFNAGRAIKREVETGMAEGGWAEIVSGLAASDSVVVEGQFGLRDGQRVAPMGQPGEQGSEGAEG